MGNLQIPARLSVFAGAAILVAGLSGCDQMTETADVEAEPVAAPAPEFAYDAQMRARLSADSLATWHDLMASAPHHAGTPGDLALAENMAQAFRDMGLSVELHPFWSYLPFPVSASLAIIEPETIPLPVTENAVAGDPYMAEANAHIGWNGYSASGTVEADVVYVNYGRKQDFEQLAALGVSLEGKIALARYGGNFRGYKAKFAEAAGAVGLIIYSDPGDAGYGQGLAYPEGGWFGPATIQRGSILTLPYSGDPLTPFTEATEDAERLDPDDVAMPRIPVQPVGWQAAEQILRRMTGDEIPDNGWQGGLPFRYRITSGQGQDSGLKLRLAVEQQRRIAKSYNVIATLEGEVEPERSVMIGAHHDAWIYGAADPLAGTIVVMELARVYAELASEGIRPRRSIQFALWGAEEMGLIGSVEWVEANRDAIRGGMVAYINLDSAAMGPRYSVSASPSLFTVYEAAAARAPWPTAENPDATLADVWDDARKAGEGRKAQRFGDLGGGSDHVGFIAEGGVPSSSVGGRGSSGTGYHSLSDNLNWYHQVVGDDYAAAMLISTVVGTVTDSLANGAGIPLDPGRYTKATWRHLDHISHSEAGRSFLTYDDDKKHARELDRVLKASGKFDDAYRAALTRLGDNGWSEAETTAWNAAMMEIERLWLNESALPNRPWFQSLYAATDESAGYAPWMLPPLRYAVEHQDRDHLEASLAMYEQAFGAMSARLEAVN